LRREFLSIHTRQDGQRMLEAAGISRFVSVSDENYDPIREVDRVAATVVSGEMKALALCC
jgi:ABC-type phosphate/phosphonate transport system substrate-binding protein